MVVREVLILGAGGVAIGLLAVWQTTSFLKSLLFGLTPADPATLVAAVAILAACALGAGYLPARHASRIEPMTALRYE